MFVCPFPVFIKSILGGFTSRRKNVPGQVKSSNSNRIDTIQRVILCLTIRMDDAEYIYHKRMCLVKSVMLENQH